MGSIRRDWLLGLVVVVMLLLPLVASSFFIGFFLTRILILGLAASSLILLSAYAGMISLAQTLMFGIAAFMIGNFSVSEAGSKGLKLGLDPWLSVVLALLVVLVMATIFGAVAARTTGIYYLMLTLTYAVIGFSFFGQVTTFSGFGGITGIRTPPGIGGGQALYFLALALSVVGYLALRGLTRTPFGIAMQGVRDDPVRMASLGFNVPLIRTVAFVLAGLVAGVAGVVFAWWNGAVAPQTIALGPTIDLLIIAVIGGIARLEGAWIGAAIFVTANTYLRELPLVDQIGLTADRFNTVIGIVVLAIMVVSPEGVMGWWERITDRRGAGRGAPPLDPTAEEPVPDGATT